MSANNQSAKKTTNPVLGIVVLFAIFAAIYAAMNMFVHSSVTNDFEKQYGMAKNGGDKMQMCVQAQLVATAYLQAHDGDNYQKWLGIKADDCKAAGLPG